MSEEKKCYKCHNIPREKRGILPHLCEKHNTCIDCGTKRNELKETPLGINYGGFRCQDCERKRIEKKIADFQEKNEDEIYFFDTVIICPFCGEKHDFDGESYPQVFFENGDHEFSCADCGNVFEVETRVHYEYETTKKIEDR